MMVNREKFWVGIYIVLLTGLLAAVSLVPLLIGQGIALTPDFIIEEDVLETVIILILFAASYSIYRGFRRQIGEYHYAVKRSRARQLALRTRLTEAFHYIGTVNVELDQIMSGLCGLTRYPLTKKELKQQFGVMAGKVMSIAHIPWGVIRIIHRNSGRTIKEYAFEGVTGALPNATIGNRAILTNRHAGGLQSIGTCQDNLVIQTVFILPAVSLSKEDLLLIKAIVNQIEMLFLIYHPVFFQHNILNDVARKGVLS